MIQRKDFIFFEEENCFRIISSKVNSINMRKFINKYNLSHIAIVTDKPRCLYLDLSETKLKSIEGITMNIEADSVFTSDYLNQYY